MRSNRNKRPDQVSAAICLDTASGSCPVRLTVSGLTPIKNIRLKLRVWKFHGLSNPSSGACRQNGLRFTCSDFILIQFGDTGSSQVHAVFLFFSRMFRIIFTISPVSSWSESKLHPAAILEGFGNYCICVQITLTAASHMRSCKDQSDQPNVKTPSSPNNSVI